MSSRGGDLLKGFVAGSLFGLALGVLFAPKSGKELREELKTEGDELLDKAKVELDKLKNELGELQRKMGKTFGRGKGMDATTEEKAFEAELNSLDEEEKAEPVKKGGAKKQA